jgi:hypothetical protein
MAGGISYRILKILYGIERRNILHFWKINNNLLFYHMLTWPGSRCGLGYSDFNNLVMQTLLWLRYLIKF